MNMRERNHEFPWFYLLYLQDKELSNFRNKNIGFVFQFHHLLPEFSAIENVMLPALIAGISKEKATEKAERLLTELNLNHRQCRTHI